MATRMPRFIKLSGRKFTININKSADFCNEYMGYYEPFVGKINLSGRLFPDQLRAVALHEIIHDLDGQAHTELGERGVNVLAALLFAALRDNPKFVQWLMDGAS